MSLTLQPGKQFGSGAQSLDFAIAPDQTVVAVWAAHGLSAALWANYGLVKGSSIAWQSEAVSYDDGETPSITIDGKGNLVELHESNSALSNGLYWHLGSASGGRASFGDSEEVMVNDSTVWGGNPCVRATSDGRVVAFYQTNTASLSLHYMMGEIVGKVVNWDEPVDTPSYVEMPSIAVNDNGFLVAGMFNDDLFSQPFGFWVGLLRNNQVVFQPGVEDDALTGMYPAVAIGPRNDIYLLFERSGSIYYRTGMLDTSTYAPHWSGPPTILADGSYPAVTIRGNTLVYGYLVSDDVYYGVATV